MIDNILHHFFRRGHMRRAVAIKKHESIPSHFAVGCFVSPAVHNDEHLHSTQLHAFLELCLGVGKDLNRSAVSY